MPKYAEPAAGLRVRGLACERGGKTLFGPIDLEVRCGGLMFVLGPNGCGKSTLLRALAGLAAPLTATASWQDEPVELGDAEWRTRIAYVGHKLGLKEELTVEENLQSACELEGLRSGVSERLGALARVGLEARRGLAVKRLSQGQKQRLALARLPLSARPLWLLDEPAAALDESAKATLAALVGSHLAARGVALVATHELIDVPGVRGQTLRLA